MPGSRIWPLRSSFQGRKLCALVLPVELERADAHDLAVLDVDHDLAGAAEEAALGQGPEDGLVGAHVDFLPRVATHIDRCPFAIGEAPSAWASVCRTGPVGSGFQPR